MGKSKVAILVGSDSDLNTIEEAQIIFKNLDIPYETHIYSAHRTPKAVVTFVENAREAGIQVIIAGAGMAAHLAGVIAAHTLLPVIGIPMEGKLEGLDSLLSTVQMPRGVPVATMAIGKTGAHNSALYAAQILALCDLSLLNRLRKYRKNMESETLKKDRRLHRSRFR